MKMRLVSLFVVCAMLVSAFPVPAAEPSESIGTGIDPEHSGGLFSSSYKEAVFGEFDPLEITYTKRAGMEEVEPGDRLEVTHPPRSRRFCDRQTPAPMQSAPCS